MSDPVPPESPPQEAPAERELVLELNFVPEWARKPPSATAFFNDRPGRRDGAHRGEPRNDRRDQRGSRPAGARPGAARPGSGSGGGRAPSGRDRDRPQRPERPPPVRPLPLHVRFLPDDRQISALIKRIRGNQRAYPLNEIVGLFLSNPDACRVKLESTDPAQRLLQCTVCGMIAFDRHSMDTHLTHEHLADFFDIETRTSEPPTGSFVCVAKCGLSGVLLGPPNHNTYAERVDEVYRTSYAHLPLEEYRRQISTHHDEALIAQWKEESRTQKFFRPKGQPAETPALKWGAAVALFLQKHGPSLVKSTAHASLSVALARQVNHPGLAQTLADAWQWECRTPRALTLAIQGALRGRHLEVFRVGTGTRFVTAVPPVPLDPERAIPSIRSVLTHLRQHPGCTRAQLLTELVPGKTSDDPEAAAILSPLRWLVDRGHIIEFFDGTMAVPLAKP